jgi:rhodanese-related sulfurtransferase
MKLGTVVGPGCMGTNIPMKYLLVVTLISLLLSAVISAEESEGKRVMIDKKRFSVTVTHAGKPVVIQRNQDSKHKIDEAYSSTARGKIQPMQPFAPRAIETVGELEVLDYLEQREKGDKAILLIDTRPVNAFKSSTIPGSMNIYWKELSNKQQVANYFQDGFSVINSSGIWNFDNAKTLILFCNGPWCGQSSAAIKKLLRAGYPAHKIKYYRGGMQSWLSFGLTTVSTD